MVFNSWEFIFVFLPLAYLGFLVAHRLGGWPLAYAAIVLASWVFYAQFSVTLLVILVCSVFANYLLGNRLMTLKDRPRAGRLLLVTGIVANLVALGYFKYMNFFIEVLNDTTGGGYDFVQLIVPVGISFYTFIQIGYLFEAYSGRATRQAFTNYALFATFFPCVTAGPLVLQQEIFGQMKDRKDAAFDLSRLSVGLTIFAMGLWKKVVCADAIAPYANVVFDGVATGATVGMTNAWIGSLAYSLQLYFDFSGYSDMAIGLGAMFGIRLPINFNSPFKATSISDFWRRWHMTMTRFFTTYVFTPMSTANMRRALSGKHGRTRKFLMTAAWPMIFTFLVAGIWHGAGWTFVIYGLIHGVALAVNHGWREFRMPKVPPMVGWLLTMAVVVNGLVVFRAEDVGVAGTIMASMWGLDFLTSTEGLAQIVILEPQMAAGLIVILGGIVLLAPNTQNALHTHWMSCDPKPDVQDGLIDELKWRPTPAWAGVTAGAMILCVSLMGADSSFLYYQF